MIKLVLTDIDDTLIPYGAPYASERTRRAIHGFLDEGLHFGPVSGRVPNAMGWMFGGDERCFATGAFANGQIIRIDGEIVREVPTDSELLREVAGVLDELGYDAWLTVYSLDECGGVAFVTSREEQLRDCLLRVGYGRPNRVAREPRKFSYLKSNVYCVCSRAQMTLIRDILRERVGALSFVFPSTVAPYIDISPAGWGKGEAVQLMAGELGVGLDEVATFGDSENDLSMIEAVPNSVAVANATEAVARAARWHVGRCADDAVARALEDLAHAARTGSTPSFMTRPLEPGSFVPAGS